MSDNSKESSIKEWLETASFFLAYLLIEGYGYTAGVKGLNPAAPDTVLEGNINEYMVRGCAHLSNIFPTGPATATPVMPLICLVLLVIVPYLREMVQSRSADHLAIGYVPAVLTTLLLPFFEGLPWTTFLVLAAPCVYIYFFRKVEIPEQIRAAQWLPAVIWILAGILFIVGFHTSYVDGVHDRGVAKALAKK